MCALLGPSPSDACAARPSPPTLLTVLLLSVSPTRAAGRRGLMGPPRCMAVLARSRRRRAPTALLMRRARTDMEAWPHLPGMGVASFRVEMAIHHSTDIRLRRSRRTEARYETYIQRIPRAHSEIKCATNHRTGESMRTADWARAGRGPRGRWLHLAKRADRGADDGRGDATVGAPGQSAHRGCGGCRWEGAIFAQTGDTEGVAPPPSARTSNTSWTTARPRRKQ